MRIDMGIKELADSLSSSTNPAITSGAVTLDIGAPVYSLPGSVVHDQAHRFVQATLGAADTTTNAASAGYGVGLGFDNTFAQNS